MWELVSCEIGERGPLARTGSVKKLGSRRGSSGGSSRGPHGNVGPEKRSGELGMPEEAIEELLLVGRGKRKSLRRTSPRVRLLLMGE